MSKDPKKEKQEDTKPAVPKEVEGPKFVITTESVDSIDVPIQKEDKKDKQK